MKVSIVILTFDRPDELFKTVSRLVKDVPQDIEIIVVDNASKTPATQVLKVFENIRCLRMPENVGVGARNEGIRAAVGELVVTLDDDVRGLTSGGLKKVIECFEADSDLAALNFKVLEEGTGRQINWCHHRKVEEWGNKCFETYEISEGAVALKRELAVSVGLYPERYFISHEGPDLALRLMDAGGVVRYDPEIVVRHAQSEVARVSWRRYYYDSRNLIWFAYKYFGWRRGTPKLIVQLGAMLIYSVRDGYLKYWFKAVRDALSGLPEIKPDAQCIRNETWQRYDKIKDYNPSVFYLLKKRIFKRNVSI